MELDVGFHHDPLVEVEDEARESSKKRRSG